MFPKKGDPQVINGKVYETNEVGGADVFTEEPTEACPRCGEKAHAEFDDNGFGPYSVQVGPFHCDGCGWTEPSAEELRLAWLENRVKDLEAENESLRHACQVADANIRDHCKAYCEKTGASAYLYRAVNAIHDATRPKF